MVKAAESLSRSGLDPAELRAVVHGHATLFLSLSGASILITGATGWFGVWLLDVLCTADDALRLGLRISAVSRRPQRFLARYPGFAGDERITWIEADVRRLDPGCSDCTHIVHGATDSSSGSDPLSPRDQFDTIVEGSRRVLATAGPRCRGLLLVSSGAIYGPGRPDGARFSETDVGGPDPSSLASVYAEGKRAAEQLGAIATAVGVPVRIARCFAFVGPHMPFDRHFAIGNFIADAVRGRPITVKSDGRPRRSYLYMTDLVLALLSVLVNGTTGRAYNVGSDAAVSIEELAHVVDRVVGGQGVVIGGAPSDPSDRYVPDTARLRAELGFVRGVELETAISKTAAWYRANIPGTVSS